MIGLLGLGIINPSLAKSAPPILDILEKIHDGLFTNSRYTPYLEKTLLTSTQNGTTFSIEEIFYDYKDIGYRYTIKSNTTPLKTNSQDSPIHVNDWILVDDDNLEILTSTRQGKYIDDYTYQEDRIITLNQVLPNTISLTLGVDSITLSNNKIIKGPWRVQTSLNQKTDSMLELIDIPPPMSYT